jgi:hypothetical protein
MVRQDYQLKWGYLIIVFDYYQIDFSLSLFLLRGEWGDFLFLSLSLCPAHTLGNLTGFQAHGLPSDGFSVRRLKEAYYPQPALVTHERNTSIQKDGRIGIWLVCEPNILPQSVLLPPCVLRLCPLSL